MRIFCSKVWVLNCCLDDGKSITAFFDISYRSLVLDFYLKIKAWTFVVTSDSSNMTSTGIKKKKLPAVEWTLMWTPCPSQTVLLIPWRKHQERHRHLRQKKQHWQPFFLLRLPWSQALPCNILWCCLSSPRVRCGAFSSKPFPFCTLWPILYFCHRFLRYAAQSVKKTNMEFPFKTEIEKNHPCVNKVPPHLVSWNMRATENETDLLNHPAYSRFYASPEF